MKRIFSIVAVLCCLVSCTLEPISLDAEKQWVEIENVSMIAHNFQFEGSPATKTHLNNNDMTFSWSSNDVVGVFPNNGRGTQVRFPIADGEVEDGTSTSNANFTGNGWAVMKAENYSSYYPFIPDMDLDMTSIPVSYKGQRQTNSATTAHLSRFDYMVTKPTEPESNGNIAFDYNHMGVILQLEMKVPKVAEYTSLSLSCEDKQFITAGTIDITKENPSITPTDWSDEFVIDLDGFTTTMPNQTIIINILIAPDDFTGKTINVKLQGPHASFVTYFVRTKPYQAGTASHPNMGDLEGGDVVLLADGPTVNQAIKSMVNGEDYILDKIDYRIKHIVFDSSADFSTMPELPHVDVSAPESPEPIFAIWDSTSETLTFSSQAYKVFAGFDAGRMFNNLEELEDVDMTDFSLDYTESIYGLFHGCKSIASIDFTGMNFTKVSGISDLFAECENLTEIVWPNSTFLRENNINTDGVFRGCKSLTNIDLSPFSGIKSSSANYMFGDCQSLTSIDLSEIDFSCAGGYTGVFSNCSSLTSLDVSGFGWQNVDGEMVWCFENCSNLKSINLGDFYIPNGGRLDGIFQGCTNLKTIEYTRFAPMGTSFDCFFMFCESLESIDVSKMVTSKTTGINWMFSECHSLKGLDLSNWNTSGLISAIDAFSGCCALTAIDFSNFVTYNVTSMEGLLMNCTNLVSITWGDNFNTEKVSMMNLMFNGCESLTSIDVSCFNTSKVIDFSDMFRGCKQLTTINWGDSFDTHYAENFCGMFNGCEGIHNLDLSFFNTASATNISDMFDSCTALETLNISSFTTAHTEDIGNMFLYCYNLSEIKLGPDFNPTNFAQSFGDCGSNQDSITIYCSPTFKANVLSSEAAHWCFTPENVIWRNCETGEVM